MLIVLDNQDPQMFERGSRHTSSKNPRAGTRQNGRARAQIAGGRYAAIMLAVSSGWYLFCHQLLIDALLRGYV